MAEDRKRLINIHSGQVKVPNASGLSYGEIAVSHSSRTDAAIYTKVSDEEVAKFISEDAINSRISGYTDGRYNELAGIVQDLADITVTEVHGQSPISATTSPIVAEKSGNTVTIYHETGHQASGFVKIDSDAYGHIQGSSAVSISDISGLNGFDDAVKSVESVLSSATTGEGNIVKDIAVSGHQITFTKGSIVSTDITDLAEAIAASSVTSISRSVSGDGNAVTDVTVSGSEITVVKGNNFALSGHVHDASEITSGVLDIARIPTGAVSGEESASGIVPTSKDVQTAIDNALTSAMNYKGATATLPTGSAVKTGDFYIASADINLTAEQSATGLAAKAESGDYLIARTGGASAKWDVVEKNLDGAVTSTGLTDGEIVIADGSGKEIKSVSASNITVGVALSAGTVDLANVQNAEDLQAIEALTATTGILKKTAANEWELANVIDNRADFSAVTSNGSLVDANLMKDVIFENERVTSAALNDLNTRVNELSASSIADVSVLSGSVVALSASTVAIESNVNNLSASTIAIETNVTNLSASTVAIETNLNAVSGSVVDLSGATIAIENDLEALSGAVQSMTFSQYASAITINGTQHDVSNNGVDLGDYLSASTPHITSIAQSETASAMTTTINYFNGTEASAVTIVQDYIIDCGEY